MAAQKTKLLQNATDYLSSKKLKISVLPAC